MRKEFRNRVDAYMSEIRSANKSEIPEIRLRFFEWYNSVSDEERTEMEPFWDEIKKEAWEVISEIKELINEIKALDEVELTEARK